MESAKETKFGTRVAYGMRMMPELDWTDKTFLQKNALQIAESELKNGTEWIELL